MLGYIYFFRKRRGGGGRTGGSFTHSLCSAYALPFQSLSPKDMNYTPQPVRSFRVYQSFFLKEVQVSFSLIATMGPFSPYCCNFYNLWVFSLRYLKIVA